jgi:hypothetical protein
MRKILGLLLGTILAVGIAGAANAKTLDWHGTLRLDLGALRTWVAQGSGVATVNSTSGSTHLKTLRLAGGITGSSTIPVTDPETTGTIPSIIITGTLLTGTITGISGGPPLGVNTIPVGGFTRVCLFSAGCEAFLPLNNTTNNGNTGVGVGGLLTLGGFGSIRISIENGPWTLTPVSGVNQTVGGGLVTYTQTGWVHGAASASNSTTADDSGVIQLIAPQQVTTTGIAGNSAKLTLFAALTLHFIPEPGLLLLIGSGVVGLALLGRSRMKR